MGYIKVIVLSAVVALSIIFMIQNITPLSHPLGIRLNLFFVNWESTPYPTYLVILLAFFVGLLAASLVGINERWRLRRQVKAQVKKNRGPAQGTEQPAQPAGDRRTDGGGDG